MHLASELMARTRIDRLLVGARGMPKADREAVALTLVKLSQLVVEQSAIAELDINPLLADASGVVALDARITVAARPGAAASRLAIRPYPKELEETVALGDGRNLLLRPIRPEDEPALRAAFAKLSPEEIRLRFLAPIKTLSHLLAARLTQLDYDREMALVLADPAPAGLAEIFGVARLAADPDNVRAEYAIILRREVVGMGLGLFLMGRLIDYARGRGIGQIFGEVLAENTAMRGLCKRLGFVETSAPDDPSLVHVTLDLGIDAAHRTGP